MDIKIDKDGQIEMISDVDDITAALRYLLWKGDIKKMKEDKVIVDGHVVLTKDVIDVYIQPVKPIEFIALNIVITKSP